jgi:uncharacterized repeat protein (TIGR04076 family)
MVKIKANDYLKHHNCTDEFFKHQFGLVFTEGAKAMADEFECYWLLDITASYQPELRREEFQVWELHVNPEKAAVVSCTDGNDRVLKTQDIQYTDFKVESATLWVEGKVILLPSEH